ncbi:MAG: hypothetical protein CMM25_05655 [Rhodospirillaceae bacterium]|nr:hypothetical protein [Rhodospirillaceae bacterium]
MLVFLCIEVKDELMGIKQPSFVPSAEEIISSASNLVPMLREHAIATENNRDLLPEIVSELKRAGIHKIFTPRRYGGFEMDWGVHVDVTRELGRGCGSTSWVSSVVFCHTWLLARFPPECQEEFWPDCPDAIIGTAFAGGGRMEETDGGFILNGEWKFSSGINHSDCAIVAAQVGDNKNSLHTGRTQVFRMAMLMPSDYEVIETWDSEGLKGTGSHDIKVVDQFVPLHRTVLSEEAAGTAPPGAVLHDNYIYKVEFSPYFFTLVAGPMLGTAMGALEEYCELTKIRSGQMFKEPIAEQVPVQVRVGESAAEIHSAHLVVDNINKYLHKEGQGARELSGAALITIRRDLAHASRQCLSAVTRLSGMMGVTAQSGRNSVQRHFRDCRTISTHGGLQWDGAMGPTGRLALGLKTGDPKVDDAEFSPFLDRALIN